METVALINYLDEFYREFCMVHPQYNVYRIGSSLFADSLRIHDIDYMLINDALETDFTGNILNLKRQFSTPEFRKARIDTFDELLDTALTKTETLLLSSHQQKVQHAFGFGPISMPDDKSIMMLHLAGPLNPKGINTFFKEFPLFYLSWSRFHIKLGPKDFTSIVDKHGISEKDISEEFARIYSRAKTIEEPYIKRQALKRLKLVELLLKDYPSPYHESVKFISPLTDEEVKAGIENYSADKLNFDA